MCSGKMSPVCYRKCSSGQCELRQSERLGRRQSGSRLLQSRNPTSEPEHDAASLDPHRTTYTGNTHTHTGSTLDHMYTMCVSYVQLTVTSCLCSQSECSWSVFRRVITIIFSGCWTTEEVSSSGPDSVMRCLWGRTGSWCQVRTCLSDLNTCLSDELCSCGLTVIHQHTLVLFMVSCGLKVMKHPTALQNLQFYFNVCFVFRLELINH